MKYAKPFLVSLFFLLSQVVVALVVELTLRLSGAPFTPISPLRLSVITIVAGLLTVAVAWRWGLVRRSALSLHVPQSWSRTAFVFLLSLLAMLVLNLLSEMLELPDYMADQMVGLIHHPLGALTIAAIAPVVEEIVFRESLLGGLLRAGTRPQWAIPASALVFGLVHGNPAQIPFAFIMGLILGQIYFRRGNILLTSLLHILNNSLAVVMLLLYGPETSLSDLLGF